MTLYLTSGLLVCNLNNPHLLLETLDLYWPNVILVAITVITATLFTMPKGKISIIFTVEMIITCNCCRTMGNIEYT